MDSVRMVRLFGVNVSIVFISSVLPMIITLLLKTILARYLGVSGLGLYTLAVTVYSTLGLFCALGIPAALTKYISEHEKRDWLLTRKIASAGAVSGISAGTLAGIITYLGAGFIAGIFNEPELVRLVQIVALIFPFATAHLIFLGIMNGLQRMKPYGFLMILQSAIVPTLAFAAIKRGGGVESAVYALVVSMAVVSVLGLYVLRDVFARIGASEWKSHSRSLVSFGGKILSANSLNLINLQADLWFVGIFATSNSVGLYSIASTIAHILWKLPNALQTMIYPLVSQLSGNNEKEKINKIIKFTIKMTSLVVLPLSIFLLIFAKEIIRIIFGTGTESAALPLRILVLGVMMYGIARSVASATSSIGRVDVQIKKAGLSGIINIILDIILIPTYGIVGAAIATTTSNFAAGVYSMMWYNKLFYLNIRKLTYMKVGLLYSLLLFGSYLAKRINIWFGMLVLISGGLIASWLLTNEKEKQILKKSLLKI